jgi:23S rRNA (adenine2030-N6)-methyltransferase
MNHAGNHGDVLKHVLYVALMKRMQADCSNLILLDTHAGIGLYDLDQQQIRDESRQGVERVIKAAQKQKALPDAIHDYVELVQEFNLKERNPLSYDLVVIRYYPGSPALALRLLRLHQDHLTLCELHPTEFQHLKSFVSSKNDNQIMVKKCNGFYETLQLPPLTNKSTARLVLIDPPCKEPQEYQEMLKACQTILSQNQSQPQQALLGQIVIMIWMPKTNNPLDRELQAGLLDNRYPYFLASLEGLPGLPGSSVLVVNPPKNFASDTVEPAIEWLALALQAKSFDLQTSKI